MPPTSCDHDWLRQPLLPPKLPVTYWTGSLLQRRRWPNSLYRGVYTLLYCAVITPAYPGLYSHSTVPILRHCTVQPHDRTEVHLYGTVLYSTAVASATGYYSRSTGTRTAYM